MDNIMCNVPKLIHISTLKRPRPKSIRPDMIFQVLGESPPLYCSLYCDASDSKLLGSRAPMKGASGEPVVEEIGESITVEYGDKDMWNIYSNAAGQLISLSYCDGGAAPRVKGNASRRETDVDSESAAQATALRRLPINAGPKGRQIFLEKNVSTGT
ncbi:hypothetical protein KIN20_019401 [Parelaphostrongylus tenuis]|uniref:Uncharacterized protein n=1 Tax=Parelaphostrongylus tenuis TaxID=148309 RepID=A0AAD5N4U0_PARTN|nr:hypothetical protein KIN20_019401 [Parelaphostrongylus tenuis]